MFTVRVKGQDTSVSDLPTLAAKLKAGEIAPDTAVYDHDTEEWTTAAEATAPPSFNTSGDKPSSDIKNDVIATAPNSKFDVVLEDVGKNAVTVIKEVRRITGLGLKEAKELVDSAPAIIRKAVDAEDAERTRNELEESGAHILITEHGKSGIEVPHDTKEMHSGQSPDPDSRQATPPPVPPSEIPSTGERTLEVGAWIVFSFCSILLLSFIGDVEVLSTILMAVSMVAICPAVVEALKTKKPTFASRGIRYPVFFICLILAFAVVPDTAEKPVANDSGTTAVKPAKDVVAAKQSSPKPVANKTRRFSGLLGTVYSITMELDVNETDQTIRGNYRYAKKQGTIPLEGKLEEGNAVLNEQMDGKTTGTFTGALTMEGFSGIWKSGNGKVTLPFKVDRSEKLRANPLQPFVEALHCRQTPSWNAPYRIKENQSGITIDCFYGTIWSDDYREERAAMEAHKLAGYYALSFKVFSGQQNTPKRYRVRYYAEAAKDKYGNPKRPIHLVTFSGRPSTVQKELVKYKSDEAITNKVLDFFKDTGISATGIGRYAMVMSAAQVWEVTRGF